MNNAATRADIDEVLSVMRDFMSHVDERFDSLERRVDNVEREIIDIKKSHNSLINTIDSFIARIDGYETEQAARDSQFNKLLEWARKVSVKTGIPLENL